MPNAKQPARRDVYLGLDARLCKGVYAMSPDAAWERYRDDLARLHQRTDSEAERQRGAWGAYQALLQQAHQDMYRSLDKAEGNKPLGAAFSHARKVAKKKGKAGNRKVERAAAQRYLSSKGHGKMGDGK